MPSPAQLLRNIIHQRQAPIVFVRTHCPTLNLREQRARQTLQRLVGQEQYRNFLRKGFISIRAASGRTYQIFAGSNMTCVWEHGKMIKKLCVTLKGDFTPTDVLIMRYILLTTDENKFWQQANQFAPSTFTNAIPKIDCRPLTEIFEELKKRAA
jgi:hypothetical protein